MGLDDFMRLKSLKEIEIQIGSLFPFYIGTLKLFIENSISLAECKCKLLKLIPNGLQLHEKVIQEILALDLVIDKPPEIINLAKYRLDTVKAIGQAERDRLRNAFGNRPLPIPEIPTHPLSFTEPSLRMNNELLDDLMLQQRLLAIAEHTGLTVADGCSEFLQRAVKMFIHDKLQHIYFKMNRLPKNNPHHPYKLDEPLTEGIFVNKEPLENIIVTEKENNIITKDIVIDSLDPLCQRLVLYNYD